VVVLRVDGGEMAGDRVHIGAGLGEGDAGFQSRNAVDAEACAADCEGRVRPLADGEVDIFGL